MRSLSRIWSTLHIYIAYLKGGDNKYDGSTSLISETEDEPVCRVTPDSLASVRTRG